MPHKTIIRLSGVARNPANGFPARPLGMYGLIIATTLRSVFLAIDGVGLAMVVEHWEGATGADKATIFVTFSALEGMLDGLRSMTDIFYGVALALLGAGIALSAVYPKWLGWVIVVAGTIWTVIGVVIGVSGSSSDLDLPLAIAFLLTVVWHMVMGIVITRREVQAM